MSTPVSVHSIVTPLHGRYLMRVPESPEYGALRHAPMVVGFHGYGESAETHLLRLQGIHRLEAWTLVSIQGLHRFYGRGGEVVASWMTTQDREQTIDYNLRYVHSVITEVIHQTGEPRALAYVGYSQGVAMAWRAAVLGARRVDALAVFGAEMPPELGVRPLTQCPPVLLGRGGDDTRYSAAQFQNDLDLLASRYVAVEPCEVPGGHEWSETVGDEVGAFLARLVDPSVLTPFDVLQP